MERLPGRQGHAALYMIFFAGFIALLPAVLIAGLAFSKKTSPALKTFSIIALVVIGLFFLVCTALLLFVVIFSEEPGRSSRGLPPIRIGEKLQSISGILIASVVVFFVLILVIVLAIRERRKK
jgi:phosphoglycerol transferase MdoB-like AlkP superfamily enzyme